jgi:hypothetical protein
MDPTTEWTTTAGRVGLLSAQVFYDDDGDDGDDGDHHISAQVFHHNIIMITVFLI